MVVLVVFKIIEGLVCLDATIGLRPGLRVLRVVMVLVASRLNV